MTSLVIIWRVMGSSMFPALGTFLFTKGERAAEGWSEPCVSCLCLFPQPQASALLQLLFAELIAYKAWLEESQGRNGGTRRGEDS